MEIATEQYPTPALDVVTFNFEVDCVQPNGLPLTVTYQFGRN